MQRTHLIAPLSGFSQTQLGAAAWTTNSAAFATERGDQPLADDAARRAEDGQKWRGENRDAVAVHKRTDARMARDAW